MYMCIIMHIYTLLDMLASLYVARMLTTALLIPWNDHYAYITAWTFKLNATASLADYIKCFLTANLQDLV